MSCEAGSFNGAIIPPPPYSPWSEQGTGAERRGGGEYSGEKLRKTKITKTRKFKI